jgi:hypothetical protein
MKNLTEQQVRQVIREELRSYLIEEGMLKNITAGIITGLAAAGLQYMLKEPVAKAQQDVEEVKNQDVDQQVFEKAEQIIIKLVTKGANEEYATQIVSRVFVGAAEEFDKNHQEKELNFQQEKIKFINEKLGELLDNDTLFSIVALDFINQAENTGRHEMVSAAYRQNQMGTSAALPSIDYAFADGFLYSAKNNYAEVFQNSRIKKDEQGNTYYLFDPMKLRYWNDKIQDGSELRQLVGTKLGDVKVPKKMFDAAQANDIEKYIAQQLQENKVNELRQRINELRGVYV